MKLIQELNITHTIIHEYAPIPVREAIPRNEEHPRYTFRRPFTDLQIFGENQAVPHAWNNLSDQEKQMENSIF